jgi:hypothetical protein
MICKSATASKVSFNFNSKEQNSVITSQAFNWLHAIKLHNIKIEIKREIRRKEERITYHLVLLFDFVECLKKDYKIAWMVL